MKLGIPLNKFQLLPINNETTKQFIGNEKQITTCVFGTSPSMNNFLCKLDCQSISFKGDGIFGLLGRRKGDIKDELFADCKM